jgi:hypothetical protein
VQLAEQNLQIRRVCSSHSPLSSLLEIEHFLSIAPNLVALRASAPLSPPLKPMDLETKTLQELRTETDRIREAAYKKDIHPTGDRRSRSYYLNFLNRCLESGLQIFEGIPGEACNSPAADLNEAAIPAIGVSIEALSRDSQSQPEVNLSQEKGNAGRTNTQSDRSSEGTMGAQLPPNGRNRSQYDGTGGDIADEGLGSQESDRILVEAGVSSGSRRGVLSHQPPQLEAPNVTPQAPNVTPQAPNVTPQAFNDEQRPPNRGDDRRPVLDIGMQVGRRSDRRHIGKICNIYRSRRGIWRAKVALFNRPGFGYFDCDRLVEQKLLYDYQMKPGGFAKTGSTFDRDRGESLEVWTRKEPPAPLTNWSLDELRALSISKLKKVARDMGILTIPGASCKRSLIRAIFAEQAIASEGRQVERQKPPIARQQFVPPSSKKRRAKTSAIGEQLSLFSLAV